MTKKSDKQPWNPFPLGVLTFLRATEGISRGAAHVLTVLAARSNYKGETCVGHRGLVKDCKSSKGYVTDALAELYDKGVVKAHPRKRAINQADWRIISPIVLQSRITDEANDSNLQDDSEIQSSYPVGLDNPDPQDDSNPTRQDLSNPNQQGETLQIKPNLAENNLTDSNLTENTKEGKKEGNASLADASYAESNGDLASLESQKLQTPSGLEAEQEQPQEQNPEPEETCFPADYTLEQKIECCGEENVNRVADIWYHATGLGDAANHRDLICDLIYLHGQDVLTYMPMALKDCPKTAGVKWRDFPYFAKNWVKTMGNVRAWERQRQAKLRDRAELLDHQPVPVRTDVLLHNLEPQTLETLRQCVEQGMKPSGLDFGGDDDSIVVIRFTRPVQEKHVDDSDRRKDSPHA